MNEDSNEFMVNEDSNDIMVDEEKGMEALSAGEQSNTSRRIS